MKRVSDILCMATRVCANNPVDVVCGGCGQVVAREQTEIGVIAAYRSGRILVDEAEHWCCADLAALADKPGDHVVVFMRSADVVAMSHGIASVIM